ncbi:MAG: general secretion pathway protein GspK [Deltaproteobacteria bacterium]
MQSEMCGVRMGSVLLVVLVVVALLALGAYTFAELMIVEAEATATYGREVQARALADSGVELTASLLEKRYEQGPQSFYSNPEWFGGPLVRDSTSAKGRGHFMVVSAAEQDTTGRSIRFGLVDESSKLNLNALAAWRQAKTLTDAQAETMLTSLSPDLTVEIADAILDWIDTDKNPMQNGAESDYYQTLNPPYPAKDNALDTLDELLLVRGMTPALLFGEDTNHNGVLDPNENDGAATLPVDNADGVLQRGLSQFLSVYSRETNLRPDGTPRINVNQSDLTALYNAVTNEFGEKMGQFILAYRLFGPASGGSSGGTGSNAGGNALASNSSGGGSGGNGSSGGGGSGGGTRTIGGGGGMSPGGGRSGTSGNTGSTSNTNTGGTAGTGGTSSNKTGTSTNTSGSSTGGSSAQGNSAGGGSNSSGGGSQKPAAGARTSATNRQNAVMVGGMDISSGAKYTLKSLYELFGAKTANGTIDGKANTSLSSPWSSTPADIATYALQMNDALTLTDNPYIDGRINVNLAPREILLGIPPLATNAALVDAIVGAQIKGTAAQSSSQSTERLTTAWLVTTTLTDINTLESLDPFITARGDVFHLQSVGYFEGGGPMARVEAVIDATQIPPQVVFMRDLTELGRGFSNSLLPSTAQASR